MPLTRRQFVRVVPGLGAFTLALPGTMAAQTAAEAPAPDPLAWPAPPPPGTPVDESFPTSHPSLAKEIVGVSHNNLARVKELLSLQPQLAKAAWDWAYGDWETALGAASHVGNRAIAEVLLETGAHPTIFSAAMLGQLEVVKAFATTIPNVHLLRGAHGIPLANHARAGGPQAAAVLAFVEALGANPAFADQTPLSSEDRAAIEGRYVFGTRPRDHFVIDTSTNGLGIKRGGASRQRMFHLSKLEFFPSGCPTARIKFERTATGTTTMTISNPDEVVRGTRV